MSTTCSVTLSRLQNIKRERKQKECQRKQKAAENRKHLANVRVVQKNLVFVVGLSQRLADPEVLKKHDYFGRFGKIHKVVINQSTSYAGSQVRGFFFIMSCYFYVKYICFILLSFCSHLCAFPLFQTVIIPKFLVRKIKGVCWLYALVNLFFLPNLKENDRNLWSDLMEGRLLWKQLLSLFLSLIVQMCCCEKLLSFC